MHFSLRSRVGIALSLLIIVSGGFALFISTRLAVHAASQGIVRTDWAQFRFQSNHTGYNPYEKVLSPSNVSALTLEWSYESDEIFSSPAVANGVVYVGSGEQDGADGTLYAVDAVTGKLKWSYSLSADMVFSSPAVANGMVYIGSEDCTLYVLDAMSGKLKWSYSTGGSINSSPSVANGVVYVGS